MVMCVNENRTGLYTLGGGRGVRGYKWGCVDGGNLESVG